VKTRFQNVPFKFNLHRSFEDDRGNIYLLHEYARKGRAAHSKLSH
jgi:hypothetical protein